MRLACESGQLPLKILKEDYQRKMSPTLKITYALDPIIPHGLKNLANASDGEGAAFSIDDVATLIKTQVGADAVISVESAHAGSPYVLVSAAKIHAACKALRDSERTKAISLSVVSAVDYLDKKEDGTEQEPRIEVVYVLFSYAYKTQVMLKVKLDRMTPKVQSISDLFRSANWYERECYDMLGITFEGHPHLERILLPPDWKGHPLRRDYEFPEEYNGMKVPL